MERTRPLLIQVAPGDARPISQQIVDEIRMQIATGALIEGDKLPSVRGLARQLTVNPNTVGKAYAELGNAGWVDTRQGLGLFVAATRQRLSDAERERRLDAAVQGLVREVVPLGFASDEVVRRVDQSLCDVNSRKRA